METTNEPRQGLRLHIWGASGLSAKALFRKTSYPFFKVGFVDAFRNWIDSPYLPYKSELKEHTNSPRWGLVTAREYTLPVRDAEYVKIELWDKELIGKELLGQVCIPLADICTGALNGLSHYDLYDKNYAERVPGKLEVEIRYMAPPARPRIQLRSKTSKRLRLKSLRTAASLYVEKLGKDALRLKIKNKQELCEALEALDIQPNINAANMFVPTSNGVDESVNAEEHRGGLNAAVSDILWDVFDADKDGEITFQEVILAVSFSVESTPEKRARFYFKIFDEDEDGQLSKAEVLHMQKMLFQLLRGFYAYSAAWRRIQGTGNERRRKRWMDALIKASTAAGLDDMPENLTEEIMATVDTNHDGHISAEEYSAFLHDLAAQEAISTQFEILAGQLKDQVEDVVSSHELASITSPVTSPVPEKKSH
eukprot:TRINITY_DN6723_c0_g1_i1.p1 TRINITY_DN6723_c0_g1~~TRINITY_DN6723_c0_g1_i1.p1  ORF type:complete len:465 (-),score=66.89 TRINITY_DN6723_c0_g1_i1:98-1369(-)